jgi:hypothetical protein
MADCKHSYSKRDEEKNKKEELNTRETKMQQGKH